MCQSQLSSPMLPSAAPTPPCAATVWERVGKTLESTATRRPACASSSAARMPEPPAPTMTASNLRTVTLLTGSSPPKESRGPHEIEEEQEADDALGHQADSGRLEVIHEDVAHADPRVVEQRGE